MTDDPSPSERAVQVVLTEGGTPVRILLQKPVPSGGRLSVLVSDDEGLGRGLFGRAWDGASYEQIVREMDLAGSDGEAALRITSATGQRGELVVLAEGRHGGEEDASDPLSLEGTTYTFLTRPLSIREIRGMVEVEEPGKEASGRRPCGEAGRRLIGDSPPLLGLLATVERVADSTASVLIQGETGTGKSLVARLVHEVSGRTKEPFVVVNCSAFQDQLLESELFGHEKGAFTGAVAAKPGLFEVADGGTLFLDEVAEMSPAMQAKLLNVLDSGELRRVGGTRSRRVDVRVLSASNKELGKEVAAGRFREDLLFRLKVITLSLPPLRDRPDDIPILVEHFLARHLKRHGGERHGGKRPGDRPGRARSVSPEALRLLCRHPWPGNVRELAHMMEGLVLLARGETIEPADLPASLGGAPDFAVEPRDEPLPMSEIERLHIRRTLRYTEGKKAPAARLLGIDVKTLSKKLKDYRIKI